MNEYDQERQVRRLLAHGGLDWDDACLAFLAWQRSVDTASVAQIRQPVYRNSISRWLLPYRDFLTPLHALGLQNRA